MGNISTNGTITANSFLGNATSATQLKNYYSSRPTSLNLTSTGSGGVISFKATSSVTDGSSEGYDGHVLHFYWDNAGGWDAQVMIPNSISGTGTRFAYRTQNGSQTWQAWKTVLDSSNYSSYALPLSGGTVTGNIYLKNSNFDLKTTPSSTLWSSFVRVTDTNGLLMKYDQVAYYADGSVITTYGTRNYNSSGALVSQASFYQKANKNGNSYFCHQSNIVISSNSYGSSLPSSPVAAGQIFYKLT